MVSEPDGRLVTICGWVRTKRDSKNLCFIQVNDGSCFASIQLTFDRDSNNPNNDNIEDVKKYVNENSDYKIDAVYFEDIQKTSGTILNNGKEIAIVGFNGNVADDDAVPNATIIASEIFYCNILNNHINWNI